MPEMIFGKSALSVKHLASATKIHFNAFDALADWKREALPPVEVPAAAKWKFRSKPFEQVILDYDYTFTTPYGGSETIDTNSEKVARCIPYCEDCDEKIDLAALASKEPILFYDELRVDDVLMRLRDTRMHCVFEEHSFPVVLRESCWRESTFNALATKRYPVDTAAYNDPSLISSRLPVVKHKTQKLILGDRV